MKRGVSILFLFAALSLSVACSVTRNIPEGSFLVQKVTVDADKEAPRKERISADELKNYIRQKPNKRLLGTNFYVWIYQQADTSKHNWWNRLKARIGQEPVLLDRSLTERSVLNLKGYMDYRGFFSSRADVAVDTVSRPKRAKLTYRTVQGEPYRIHSISYDFRDRFLKQIVLPDTVHTLLHEGDIFDLEVLDNERGRIASFLRERGYYDFTVNNIEYLADTLRGNYGVDLQLIVKQHREGYDRQGNAIMQSNTVYRVDRVTVFPAYNPQKALEPGYRQGLDTLVLQGLSIVYPKELGRPNLRASVLRRIIPVSPGYAYNERAVEQAYNRLMSMGYFRSANISFTPAADSTETVNYVTFVGEGEDTDSLYQTRERYLHCDIQGIPELRQSYKIEVDGSYTSSFYGLRATVGYQNRNAFRGAETFDAAVTVGYEYMTTKNAKRRHATEFGFTTGLQFPRFILPWNTRGWRSVRQPGSRIALGINFQNRPNYRRILSSASWGYSWNDLEYSSYTLRPIDINVVDVGWIDDVFYDNLQNRYLKSSYDSQFIGGLSFGYVYNNQPKHLGGDATVVRLNFETAGNLVDGLAHLFWKPAPGQNYYNVFGLRYAQYFRVDLSVSRKIMLGEVSAVVGRFYGGYALGYGNSRAFSIPFDRQFYAGGANSMRGWTPRTLGAGSQSEDRNARFPSRTGDMKLEANVEFRFPIWGIFHGATFFDVGNVWFADPLATVGTPDAEFHFNRFYKQLGFDTGIGVRMDVKFAVIRLDWGVQLHSPNRPAGERWIRRFKWNRTALNFGVGYPF